MYVDIYIYVSRWVLRVFPSELVFLLFHNHFLILLNSFEVLTFYRMHFWNYSDFYSYIDMHVWYIDMHVNMCVSMLSTSRGISLLLHLRILDIGSAPTVVDNLLNRNILPIACFAVICICRCVCASVAAFTKAPNWNHAIYSSSNRLTRFSITIAARACYLKKIKQEMVQKLI